ncbi:hypothetical protein ATY77_00065 [Rhizobium sp. R634]|uniref:hypothetical protein n=1 Tax=Rhizobium sp. R634 TaxID=1764274 RepID=UPI000B52D46C|nr:hypothetical protein [Rhizobium sp. R634]OWV81688.1 hypothetical protein ATY77_00065 [Rhizobium sp. R634]
MTTKNIDAEIKACDLKAHYRPVALKAVVAALCIRPKVVVCGPRESEADGYTPHFRDYPEFDR